MNNALAFCFMFGMPAALMIIAVVTTLLDKKPLPKIKPWGGLTKDEVDELIVNLSFHWHDLSDPYRPRVTKFVSRVRDYLASALPQNRQD